MGILQSLIPMTGLPVPWVPHLWSSSPGGEARGGQQALHSVLLKALFHPSLLLLHVTSGGDDGPGKGQGPGGSGKGQCCSAIDALTCSSGQLSSCFSGCKDQKAKCFLRGRKREKKLFPSAEPKAALLIQKFLFSVTEQSGKGRNPGLCLPNGKENYSKRFLHNMYRARCKTAPQIQNTQQYLKTNRNRDGPMTPPNRSWEGMSRLKFRAIFWVGTTLARWGEGVHTDDFHG